jgi:type II secretory pathway component PulF
VERYHIEYADEQGTLRKNDFETNSLDDLRKSLIEQGCYVLSEQPRPYPLQERLQRAFSFGGGVSLSELTEFTTLLKTLLKSGLTLKDALDVLLDEVAESALTKALRQIRDDIMEGVSFSKALSRHPAVFPDIYVRTVVAGERAGALDQVLERLNEHFRNALIIRQKVLTAVIYPSFLVVVAIGAITFLLIKVVPEFQTMFRDMGVPLHWFTELILGLSHLLAETFYLLIGLGALALYGFRRYYTTTTGRRRIDGLKLRIPVLRTLEETFAYSQFTRTLATLVEGGIPLMESLQVVIDSLENKEISHRFSRVTSDIQQGDTFAKALKNVQGISPTLVKVVHVGEESGNLGGMLTGIADHFDEQLSTTTTVLTSMIEPILFLIIALSIGLVLIALLLPIITAATSINFGKE